MADESDDHRLPLETMVAGLRSMYLIRHFEERCMAAEVSEDIAGAVSLSLGQEAAAVALADALREGDMLFPTHRNRGHLLARGADAGRVMAELWGRSTGYCHGKGGSFHLAAPELGIPASTAIIGASAPLAVGAAFGLRHVGDRRLAVASVGDRSLNEGGTWEAVNMAALWQLPVMFVCENNDAVPYDPRVNSGVAADSLGALAEPYDIEVSAVDGRDYVAVRRILGAAVAAVRDRHRPCFVEVRTARWPGHHGRPKYELIDDEYTSLLHGVDSVVPVGDGRHSWLACDPIVGLARILVDVVGLDGLRRIEREVHVQVDAAVGYARASAWPRPNTALEDVYG